ncbi:MAG: ATP-binding protein [Gammaproteobacteria bacterium]
MLQASTYQPGSITNAADGHAVDARTWKPLRVFNIYRLILSGFFTILMVADKVEAMLGFPSNELFRFVTIGYLSFALVVIFTITRRSPEFKLQVYLQTSVDIAAITLMMFAAGGVSSGLGVLMVVAVAGGSMLMSGRMAGLFAAMATVFAISAQAVLIARGLQPAMSLSPAGLLGATFFATSFAIRLLANRVTVSENLAARRGVEVAKLADLNHYIIQHMQSGVLAVDDRLNIELINDAAREMIGVHPDDPVQHLRLCTIAPDLCRELQIWREGDYDGRPVPNPGSGVELLPRFRRLSDDPDGPALIFLEDAATLCAQAQEMRLSSLGRLTASIAHEIRNPLGAISHAGQLLEESDLVSDEDQRLTQIIRSNSVRVNDIVESVLQLSRRGRSAPQAVDLKVWLPKVIENLKISEGHAPTDCALTDGPAIVRFDADQLHQIVSNLCRNAHLHAGIDGVPGEYKLVLEPQNGRLHLDIIDTGPGIPQEARARLFEPFFSTHNKGTGLGLYIARELCTSNGAHLSYARDSEQASRFRISFARTTD